MLGVCVALAVLLQASLLALIIARAFHGAPLHALWVDIGLLLAAFLARGALAWGMEMAGRRAAWSVLSELRLALIEKRLRAQPTAVDGTEGAEIATVSVQGIEALEGYFARYLPQVVLAAIVPLLVLVWVAIVDLETALIMLLTLPLVPVFMALIGRYTEHRTASALAGFAAPLDAFSRRGPRPADAARLWTSPRSGGRARRGRRALPRHDHGDAQGELPVGRRCWSWRRRSGSHWSP